MTGPAGTGCLTNVTGPENGDRHNYGNAIRDRHLFAPPYTATSDGRQLRPFTSSRTGSPRDWTTLW